MKIFWPIMNLFLADSGGNDVICPPNVHSKEHNISSAYRWLVARCKYHENPSCPGASARYEILIKKCKTEKKRKKLFPVYDYDAHHLYKWV